MKKISYQLKLGIFVTIGLAIFIFAIFWIGKQKHMFNPTSTISSVFTNISGLQVGNNVRFSGINVGTVDFVSIINDTSVRVTMVIDNDVLKFIKKDSYAMIGSEGLMGDRIITITQGNPGSPSVQNKDQILSMNPVETDEILANLKVTSENATVITDQLAEILIKINTGQGTLGKLISDSTIAESFYKTMENMKTGTKGFSENMEAAKSNFLLRGFFKRKEREAEKAKKEMQEKQEEKKKK
jgi:phospholipid/cholesterol/gamma-HCH transport system substrate-binding protein